MEKPMTHGRTRSEAGFSLVEVLVAMTITLIISGAIYGLLASGQGAFKREPELTDRQQNARIALNLIMRDIANAGSGMPPFTQVFTVGLNAFSLAPQNAFNVGTDELEMLTNTGARENEPVCNTLGSGNGSGIRLFRGTTTIPDDTVVILFMADGTWSMRNVRSTNNNSGTSGDCDNAPHVGPNFGQGGDTTGLNQPSGACIASPGPGTTTDNNCRAISMSFATLVRYRIRNDAAGVPVLQRFSSDNKSAFSGGAIADAGYQTIARGIEDLQIQYHKVGDAATTWTDVPTAVVTNTYTTLTNEVAVTLVARSEARQIQGARTSTSGKTNIRGTLTSTGTPRSILLHLSNAPSSPSPKPWI
jgi:prepilin-type N-terminal cleavage/methylation domain-containing protein